MKEKKLRMKKIQVAVPNLCGNEKKYVMDCMDTTWISSNGKYVNEFEDRFAQFANVDHAIACCNGTVALHVPLVAMGLGDGDEVIVPSFTYIATANAVKYCGATPVFADCLMDTWNVDPADIEKKITSKTKGIIPVHLYGNPCDMDAIMAIAKKYNLFVLEDAAECHGATYKGKKAGSIGDAAIFSFFGNKIITCGEGGMIVTNDKILDSKMRQLKGQGQDPTRKYWFTEIGYNYRMTNIAAAIGLGQLENIDKHISFRIKVAQWYMEELKDFRDYLQFQEITRGAESVWWMFSIRLTDRVSVSRDEIMQKMEEKGIETRPLFYPMHIMPVYEDKNARCPVSEKISSLGMNLPTHGLLTRDDVKYICDTLKSIILK